MIVAGVLVCWLFWFEVIGSGGLEPTSSAVASEDLIWV